MTDSSKPVETPESRPQSPAVPSQDGWYIDGRQILIFVAVWGVLGWLTHRAFGWHTFVKVKPDALLTFLPSLLILAFAVERFASIFVRPYTAKRVTAEAERKYQTQLAVFNERMLSSNSVRKDEDRDRVETDANIARLEAARQHAVSQAAAQNESKEFQRLSLLAGLVVACLGFRLFVQCADVAYAVPPGNTTVEQVVQRPMADLKSKLDQALQEEGIAQERAQSIQKLLVEIKQDWARTLFYFVDVLLTAVLLSGGSTLLKQVTGMLQPPGAS